MLLRGMKLGCVLEETLGSGGTKVVMLPARPTLGPHLPWLDMLIPLIFPENMQLPYPRPSHPLTPFHLYPDVFSSGKTFLPQL